MKRKRLKPDIRKENILKAALKLAAVGNYLVVTRDEIAKAVGVTGPALQYHFGTMARLRNELMRYAVRHRHPRVVAQGLATRNPQALKADDELKQLAKAAL